MERDGKEQQLPLDGFSPKKPSVYENLGIEKPTLKEKAAPTQEPKKEDEDTQPTTPVNPEVLEFYGIKNAPEPAKHWSDRD